MTFLHANPELSLEYTLRKCRDYWRNTVSLITSKSVRHLKQQCKVMIQSLLNRNVQRYVYTLTVYLNQTQYFSYSLCMQKQIEYYQEYILQYCQFYLQMHYKQDYNDSFYKQELLKIFHYMGKYHFVYPIVLLNLEE